MKRTAKALLIPTLLLVTACREDPAPAPTVALQVNDACGTGGLGGATVMESGGLVGATDSSGSIAISNLTDGEHTFDVSMAAYLPQSVTVTVAGGSGNGSVDLVCQAKAVGDMARAFTAQIAGGFSGVTSASSLQTLLADGNAANDPTVISVRAATAYAKGHVPGAINIPWKTVADDPVTLLGQPFDSAKTFVDYCYTGHTGAIAAGVLNVLGYKTQNMKFGMTSWTMDTSVWDGVTLPDYYCDESITDTTNPLRGPCAPKSYELETTTNTPTATYDLPVLTFANVTNAWEAARAAAKAYLSDSVTAATITADALHTLLNDGNPANDPFIISIRAPGAYANGHIPGAVNIPYADIAKEDNLRKIPTDRDVVVYCYTGHTGGIATGILGTLGYHRVKNLRYGMFGWNASVPDGTKFSATDLHDYPFVVGSDPGTWQ